MQFLLLPFSKHLHPNYENINLNSKTIQNTPLDSIIYSPSRLSSKDTEKNLQKGNRSLHKIRNICAPHLETISTPKPIFWLPRRNTTHLRDSSYKVTYFAKRPNQAKRIYFCSCSIKATRLKSISLPETGAVRTLFVHCFSLFYSESPLLSVAHVNVSQLVFSTSRFSYSSQ